MCKGVAVLVNFKECIIGDGSSHSDATKDKDDYLALNVIYDDNEKSGYRIEADTHGDKAVIEHYHERLFFLDGMPNPKLMAMARKEIKRNEGHPQRQASICLHKEVGPVHRRHGKLCRVQATPIHEEAHQKRCLPEVLERIHRKWQ